MRLDSESSVIIGIVALILLVLMPKSIVLLEMRMEDVLGRYLRSISSFEFIIRYSCMGLIRVRQGVGSQ